jgi:hypothetical protein
VSSSAISSSRTDPPGEAAQRELGGVDRIAETAGVGAQAPAQTGLAVQCLGGGELLAQFAGGGEDQTAELQHRRGAGLHGAVACDAQLADRLDDPGGLLGGDRRCEAQRVTCGQFGVDRVGLAAPAPGVRVGLVDLEHLHALRDEMPGQSGGEGAGRLHTDPVDRAEAAQPRQQVAIARRGDVERLGCQKRSAVVERRGVMAVGVRVDATDDATPALVHALHRCPSLIGGTAGRVGGHNSDEALVASRFL